MLTLNRANTFPTYAGQAMPDQKETKKLYSKISKMCVSSKIIWRAHLAGTNLGHRRKVKAMKTEVATVSDVGSIAVQEYAMMTIWGSAKDREKARQEKHGDNHSAEMAEHPPPSITAEAPTHLSVPSGHRVLKASKGPTNRGWSGFNRQRPRIPS